MQIEKIKRHTTSKLNFLDAIYKCNQADTLCRISQINSFGLNGILSSFQGIQFSLQPEKPVPSFDKVKKEIYRVMNYVADALEIAPQHRLLVTGFKLLYTPHFVILKGLEDSCKYYWESIRFLQWGTEAIKSINEITTQYLNATQEFKLSNFLNFLSNPKITESKKNEVPKELKLVATTLSEFDRLLLSDIEELVITLIKGIEQAGKSKKPKNTFDRLGTESITKNLEMMDAMGEAEALKVTVRNLQSHYNSWNGAYKSNPIPYASFENDIEILRRRIRESLEKLRNMKVFSK